MTGPVPSPRQPWGPSHLPLVLLLRAPRTLGGEGLPPALTPPVPQGSQLLAVGP